MKTLTVGRAPENDICINNITVSRKHLKVVIGDKVMIEDLNSANGTFVNENPVKSAYITQTDSVRLGSMKLDTINFFKVQPQQEKFNKKTDEEKKI